jgi:hypothetical protein
MGPALTDPERRSRDLFRIYRYPGLSQEPLDRSDAREIRLDPSGESFTRDRDVSPAFGEVVNESDENLLIAPIWKESVLELLCAAYWCLVVVGVHLERGARSGMSKSDVLGLAVDFFNEPLRVSDQLDHQLPADDREVDK